MLDAAAILPLLQSWVPGQRWYPRKGERVTLALAACLPIADDVAVLILDAGGVLLQVPVAVRGAADGHHVIGALDDRVVVDACHDRDAVMAMLAAPDGSGLELHGSVPPAGSTEVLRAEQSNTSIIGHGPTPWIAKVLRVVAPGEHPDVSVTSALTAVGCQRVPALLASVEGAWAGTRCTLVAVSELVEGAHDAWALHLADAAAVLDGGRIGLDPHALGGAVAEVHAALAVAFGTTAAGPSQSRAIVDDLIERISWTRVEADDALADLDDLLDEHAASVASIDDVGTVQRIHGDLHLGQVLHHAERGDVLLDFEGEPLRPIAERAQPQPAARDVAGMLRSIDYAAGSVAGDRGLDPSVLDHWTRSMQSGFLDGYRARGGVVGDDAVLRALMIDKALYELVYEMRNRPTWVHIPRRAIEDLLRR